MHLRDAMVVQRWNDQKVDNRARAKAQHKWDKLIVVAKQCPPLPKPTLVKLALQWLLQVLGLNAWGVKNMPQNATSWIEKDENLQENIWFIRFAYARQLKMAWDVKNWARVFGKANQTKELTNVLDFHESKLIHGR